MLIIILGLPFTKQKKTKSTGMKLIFSLWGHSFDLFEHFPKAIIERLDSTLKILHHSHDSLLSKFTHTFISREKVTALIFAKKLINSGPNPMELTWRLK